MSEGMKKMNGRKLRLPGRGGAGKNGVEGEEEGIIAKEENVKSAEKLPYMQIDEQDDS